jgi:RNA polymerase sigma-70 factor (ECF subfamily)
VPRAPEAWLLQVARRKTLDAGRRRQVRQAAMDPLRMIAEAAGDPGPAIPDERLRLMFACAHPALDPAVRAPLILQCVLGFDAVSIGTAFLVTPAAMGQRLVRAKRKIRDAGVPFRVPDPDELAGRLDAVLDAIYAVFAAGWTDPALTEEALWLGRLVVALLDREPEALGLLALMLHVQARRPARRDANGTYIPLSAQNPADWQDELIEEAEALLLRASRLQRIGRFQLEAAIQSAHAARRLTGLTAWAEVVALYDALLARTESPVVALNRAVAVGELHGAAAGLAALDRVAADQRLADYQPYWAARATLLADTGDADAADAAYARAIGLEPDQAVRRFLQRRRAELARAADRPRSI